MKKSTRQKFSDSFVRNINLFGLVFEAKLHATSKSLRKQLPSPQTSEDKPRRWLEENSRSEIHAVLHRKLVAQRIPRRNDIWESVFTVEKQHICHNWGLGERSSHSTNYFHSEQGFYALWALSRRHFDRGTCYWSSVLLSRRFCVNRWCPPNVTADATNLQQCIREHFPFIRLSMYKKCLHSLCCLEV